MENSIIEKNRVLLQDCDVLEDKIASLLPIYEFNELLSNGLVSENHVNLEDHLPLTPKEKIIIGTQLRTYRDAFIAKRRKVASEIFTETHAFKAEAKLLDITDYARDNEFSRDKAYPPNSINSFLGRAVEVFESLPFFDESLDSYQDPVSTALYISPETFMHSLNEFSPAEQYGRFIDMNLIYTDLYLPLASAVAEAATPQQNLPMNPGLLNTIRTVSELESKENYCTYLEFLSMFDTFPEISAFKAKLSAKSIPGSATPAYAQEDCIFNHVEDKYSFKFASIYLAYLEGILSYLVSFVKKTSQLYDIDEYLYEKTQNIFNKYYDQGFFAIRDADSIADITDDQNDTAQHTSETNLFCAACDKVFTNPSVFKNHFTGKIHKKKQHALPQSIHTTVTPAASSATSSSATSSKKTASRREINKTQFLIHCVTEDFFRTQSYLADKDRTISTSTPQIKDNTISNKIKNTILSLERKKHLLADDLVMAEELDLDSDTERNFDYSQYTFKAIRDSKLLKSKSKAKANQNEAEDESTMSIYNPKNLPVGNDGQIIPYWLFKLHGLNKSYTCEICMGAVYRGPLAFRSHFTEATHAAGLKRLGIPNTKHLHNITDPEKALKLYEKLKQTNQTLYYDADKQEQYEDSMGNLISKQMYQELLENGLL